MKRILAVASALALVGYLGCGAYAADMASSSAGTSGNSDMSGSGMVKAGSEKIAISGGMNYGDVAGNVDAYASAFMVQGEYGYMVCDQFELAARAMVLLAQAGSSGTTARLQAYSLTAVPKYRFASMGSVSPYIGPKLGLAYATASGTGAVKVKGITSSNAVHDSVFIWGAVLGADIFLSRQTALFVELDYTQFKLGGSDLGGGPIRVRDTGISAGLAYWW